MNEAVMRRRLALIVLFSVATVWNRPITAEQNQQQPAKQKKSAGKAQQATLTGCVDQHDGQDVLIHDQTRSLIAHLEAEGFPQEGFAKHVGHKVSVRGIASPNSAESPV